MSPRSSASILIAIPPAEVFAFITDIDRLSTWNDLIAGVVTRPSELAAAHAEQVS